MFYAARDLRPSGPSIHFQEEEMATALKIAPPDDKTSSFVASKHKLLINGKWLDSASGKTFPTYNPATGDILAQCAEGDRADIDLAVSAARTAFESGPWRKMTASERGRAIWKLADLLEENLEEFAELESLDNGKPLKVARAADVPLAVDLFRYMAGWTTKISGHTFPISVPYTPGAQYLAYTLREPVGVVGQIIPWNFPLLMAAWKLGPALATGCTVVLKPAEQTPLSALRLGELIQDAGIPDGVVNIVTGYGETAGAALAAHPDVDKIAFTGSTEVGRLIVQAAAGNLKKVSLELGGKSPNIVLADVDVDSAVAGASSAIFFNHGQCCCAGSRLYVEEKVFDKVVDGVSARAKKIRLGPGLDPSTDMGPLVSVEQLNRVCGYLESGFSEGAHATAGGHRFGDKGYFVEPTVLTNTNPQMKVVQEEIFGPVVTAIPFRNEDELIAHANDTPYGLAAGIWTNDTKKANRIAAQLRAGTVWINCYNIFDAALPFGGYKQSGWGREMGGEALEMYTEVKSVCSAM
jgi:phenylacetaldehyde dehydrogenase